MMLPYVKPVNYKGIVLEVKDDYVCLSGNIGVEHPGKFMEAFFIEVHDAFIKAGVKEVRVDIKNLKFLNSSGIKEIVKWVLNIDQMSDETKYSLTILYNSDILWQEACISSIVNLNPNLIKKVAL